jgi:hypothetical protein
MTIISERRITMTTKFKIGDKAVRTQHYEVEGSGMHYDSECFELVEPTFKAMKFRVNSPEQSKEIQEALFSMGYEWQAYGQQVKFVDDYMLSAWLHTDEDGILCRCGGNIEEFHPELDNSEYTIKATKSYELIPVEIPKEELIELMGQKYSKKELEDALRSLKPIK